jgi:broad specificity phosphatase PhoE
MIQIIFESHATSLDNERGLASGHYDVDLSELGEQQASQLGERHKGEHFDAIFVSDLKRSFETGELAFGKSFPIIKDSRLRECDYGDLTRKPDTEIASAKAKYIHEPFPGGESYVQVAERMKSFLQDLLKNYDGKKVMIIGHRATQYGLEHWINGVQLKQAITAPWHWQPGWEYKLK